MSDPYAGLTSTERKRLERFAEAFDELDAAEYALLTGEGGPHNEVVATEDAAWAGLSSRREAAIKDAVRAFQVQIDLTYARRMPIPYVPNAVMPLLSTRPEDHRRLMDSIRRAVLAVALWDTLSAEDRTILVGGWARLTDRAGFEG